MGIRPTPRRALLLLAGLLACGEEGGGTPPPDPPPDPPFWGTIFIAPDLITDADPTALQEVTPAGQGARTMFDRRVEGWVTVDAYLFDATFQDGLALEVQVNPEFETGEAALEMARRFAEAIGRLPTALRAGVETVWIHRGVELFGGGNDNILIHTGQADQYEADGILEETLVHEAVHSSLDSEHATAPGWRAAQNADNWFISAYARDHPTREDLAESFVPYLAVRARAERVAPALRELILQVMPARVQYLDGLSLDLHPLQ
ncbi:MAG: hypothetical protein JSU98_09100 [Gemmatimonadales bacterium]|jgi:hypothetical protein|nr:MAG: hypothetical protein JSU98_09100 [Gemmatimonadales bacterium]